MICDRESRATGSFARSAPRMFVVHKNGSIIARTEDEADVDTRAEIVSIAARLVGCIRKIEAGATMAMERLSNGRVYAFVR